MADALSLLCPPNKGEVERRAALTLVLRGLTCICLEELGLASGELTRANFAEVRRHFGGDLFREGPYEAGIDALSPENFGEFEGSLRQVAKHGPSAIGRCYEELLELRPGLDRGRRKASGSFYTPEALAKTTVARGLAPCLHDPAGILELKICDPAMGTGGFLLPALDSLSAALVAARGEDADPRDCTALVAENCLYGVDLDPIAVQLTGMLIWFRVGDFTRPMDAFAGNLLLKNALLGSVRDWAECFPEVFTQERGGFDAIIGNPPWETNKPSSREFFARHDRHFPQLSKQAAITRQRELCADARIAVEWERCLQQHKEQSKFFREHYRHQGVADLNAYKLFLERSHDLLRDGGRLAFIVPGAIYSDLGSRSLREVFLDQCRWEWLFAFENRERIFPIDSRFKFCALILIKGGRTETLRCAFMQRSLNNWEAAEESSLEYSREDQQRFSPEHRVLLEFTDERDKSVLAKIHQAGQVLSRSGEGTWDLRYGREFDTTLDSALFPPRPSWEDQGYRQTPDGRWLLDEEVSGEALPLFEGRMIAAYSCRAKGWVSGRGRRAHWEELPDQVEGIGPQFLMAAEDYRGAKKACPGPRVAFMRIASATNERSMIATYLARVPMADSLFYLRPGDGSLLNCLAAICILNSFCFDFQVRRRLGGLNMSWFMLSETVLPDRLQAAAEIPWLATACAALALQGPMFAPEARQLSEAGLQPSQRPLDPKEKQDLRASIEAKVARLYGLDADDFAWILRDCEHPTSDLRRREFQRTLDPKGFWRCDRDLAPEDRLSTRSLMRFRKMEGDRKHD